MIALDVSRQEIRRYLGYGTHPVGEREEQQITHCLRTLTDITRPRSIFRAFPLVLASSAPDSSASTAAALDSSTSDSPASTAATLSASAPSVGALVSDTPMSDTLTIADVPIRSRHLARNLAGCHRVYLMAATLGMEADRQIARAAIAHMSEAVIYQAVAAALLEAYCDRVNETIRQEAAAQGGYCRPRFSPGYGDFAITHQSDFARLLDLPRRIGVMVTDTCQLVPMKSVTAVVGVAATPTECPSEGGCAACGKTNCTFRRPV